MNKSKLQRGEKRVTIIEAIKYVMREQNQAMAAKEAYAGIVEKGLYEFHAQNPEHIVRTQIRRHCEGIDFPSAASTKHFKLVGDDRFYTLDKPKRTGKRKRGLSKKTPKARATNSVTLARTLKQIQELHEAYIEQLKLRIIGELRKLSPAGFEIFAKRLLDVYGFKDTVVTQVSKDGGIDGHGKLNVGLAHLNVAFQCKKWTKGNIQRTEIDKFRGAIQGDFEQGIFFATTSFSSGAIDASIKRGAVPVMLIDAQAIVDLMINKGFGVQIEGLAIPTYALDLALTSENESQN